MQMLIQLKYISHLEKLDYYDLLDRCFKRFSLTGPLSILVEYPCSRPTTTQKQGQECVHVCVENDNQTSSWAPHLCTPSTWSLVKILAASPPPAGSWPSWSACTPLLSPLLAGRRRQWAPFPAELPFLVSASKSTGETEQGWAVRLSTQLNGGLVCYAWQISEYKINTCCVLGGNIWNCNRSETDKVNVAQCQNKFRLCN